MTAEFGERVLESTEIKECPCKGITNDGRVWRKDVGKHRD